MKSKCKSNRKDPPKVLGVGEVDAIGHELNSLGKKMTEAQYEKRKSFGEDIAELFPEKRVDPSVHNVDKTNNDNTSLPEYEQKLKDFAETHVKDISFRDLVGSGIGWKMTTTNLVPDLEHPNYTEKMKIYSTWLKDMRRKSSNN